MSEQLTINAFQQNIRSRFTVVRPGVTPVTLDLIGVQLGQCTPTQEQFSVVFNAPTQPFLGQGLFRLEHDRMGAFDLFLVPVARDNGHIRYEAVFNRFRKSSE